MSRSCSLDGVPFLRRYEGYIVAFKGDARSLISQWRRELDSVKTQISGRLYSKQMNLDAHNKRFECRFLADGICLAVLSLDQPHSITHLPGKYQLCGKKYPLCGLRKPTEFLSRYRTNVVPFWQSMFERSPDHKPPFKSVFCHLSALGMHGRQGYTRVTMPLLHLRTSRLASAYGVRGGCSRQG